MILAIDPGTDQTAYVAWDGSRVRRIRAHAIVANEVLLEHIRYEGVRYDLIAIEMIASYGMPVGREVFETCLWIGRFIEAARLTSHRLVYRRDVKLELCGDTRAKDANVRKALIDRFGPISTTTTVIGPKGGRKTKVVPGPLFGICADEWAALGVAVTTAKLLERKEAA